MATGMFERFSQPARRVVVLAQEHARELNHNYIGTEHVLLGLLHEGDSSAAQALLDAGLSIEVVREDVARIIGTGTDRPKGHIPFTPRVKKSFELALRSGPGRTQPAVIAPGHLLLGLLHEGEGVAAQIIRAHTEVDALQECVLQSVRPYPTMAARRAGRQRRSRFTAQYRRRAAGMDDYDLEESAGVDIHAVLERLAIVEDARVEEARGRAIAEAKLERMESMRAELERAREEIAELRKLLGQAEGSQ